MPYLLRFADVDALLQAIRRTPECQHHGRAQLAVCPDCKKVVCRGCAPGGRSCDVCRA